MKNLFIVILSSIVFVSCNSKNDAEKTDKKIADEIAFQKELEKAVRYVSGRDSVSAYLSLPPGEGPFPGLIVIHERWGLNNWIRTNADAFANKGFAALAVDLYRGKSTTKTNEASDLMLSLKTDRVNRDLQAAYSFLRDHPKVDKNRIGVVGWNMGGGYALQAAMSLFKLKAAVMNYGNITLEASKIRKIDCPLLGIFGETDRGISVMDVQNFQKALDDAKKENRIIIYRNVGHAFMNQNNKEGYNNDITERAWREIFGFLEKHLMK
jgi:carboxymethylenebutenolidase